MPTARVLRERLGSGLSVAVAGVSPRDSILEGRGRRRAPTPGHRRSPSLEPAILNSGCVPFGAALVSRVRGVP